ncbi:MAG: hypothetical protein HQ537_00065 [Parcubacteria group bacterium]|nr:hypothetical protein [Parcubacteria group bacterium]
MTQSKTKICQNCKAKFTIEPEDFEFYKKIDVPEPTFCPDCRMQRRFAFQNETNLYKRKCDFSKKKTFSVFSPEAPIKIYDQEIWWSDKWDPLKYGHDYDFNKSFLKQIKKLSREVPWASRMSSGLVNSDYSMQASFLKNCYLLFFAGHSENCAYGNGIDRSNNCYDNHHLRRSELCYEGFMLNNCYKTFFSSHCTDCQEIYFCKDCINCSNCFGCANLRHKKYHIFNKSYAKEEYFKKLEEFNTGSYKSIQELNNKTKQLHLKFPVKYMHGRKNVNVFGEYIDNSKNVKDSYLVKKGENLRYCHLIWDITQDCYDYYCWGEKASLIYEGVLLGNGLNQLSFCFNCWPNCRDMEYCLSCHSSSNLFACVGLRHKQYCILNKQYTKEQYEELVPKIKEHMNKMPYVDKNGRVYKYGEFFPVELSPFAYNETIANEYFPLTKQQAIDQGYTWHDKPKSEYKPTIKAKNLPDSIKDVDNSILKEVIQCSSDDCAGSGVFRLIPTELKFYKKMNFSLPRLCPDCRHRERIKQRNPMKLWERQCMNKGCNTTFQTTYAPDRKEIIYCEACYNKEIG